MKQKLLFLFISIFSLNLSANISLPEPDLRCLSVDSVGGVRLSLVYPEEDTNITYEIYYSKQVDGLYTLLGSVNYPNNISEK
jgi:hypothetical protein